MVVFKRQGFASSIKLNEKWPEVQVGPQKIDVSGQLLWANTYFDSAFYLLEASRSSRASPHYAGPVIQNVGVATELALKTLLYGCGMSDPELKKFSHNTYGAYCAALAHIDEMAFLNLVLSNSKHLRLPDEIKLRGEEEGEYEIDLHWRCYFQQLRILDGVYDKPYRSRYVTAGKIVMPEAEIILIGTKILLAAMNERTAE